MKLSLGTLLVLALLSPIMAGAANDPCQFKDVQFAHCPQATRNFYSAIVAVHGWGGSCGSTFGKQDHSLYRILKPRKFYDWDCFEYDSHHLSIDENARHLREQLRLLKDAGYRQVLLTTHSTGGILALELLADEYASPRSGAGPEDLPRITGVLAWATPINGLRSLISGGGAWLTRAGFSPETLPDLKADSPYLQSLKARLKAYNLRYLAADPLTKGKMKIKVWFLQGQGEDMVVRPIVSSDAVAEGWYWPDRGDLVDTQDGHTHNVGEAGTAHAPRYPAAMLDMRALLELQVTPRFGDVFPEDVTLVTESLEGRQTDVVEGLTFFAEEQFAEAFTPALAFLRRIYQGSFERSRKVDERLVFGFLDLLKMKAADPDENLVRFFDSFVRQVLIEYNPALGQDIRRLGHGNSRIAQAVLETAEVIRQAVNRYIVAHPESGSLLASSGGLDQFNADLVGFSARFLDSEHGPAQYAALSILESALPGLSDETIVASGVLPRINSYYLTGGYRNLSFDAKAKVQGLYLNLVGRGGAIQTATLAALNTRVAYLGSQRPSWVALADDSTVRSLLTEIEPQPAGSNKEQLRFAASVAAHAGATGTDTEAAFTAVEIGKDIVANTENPAARRALEIELRKSVARSDYPAVQQSYSPP